MLNKIWPMFMIISIIYAIMNGNTDKINASIFSSTQETVTLLYNIIRNYMSVEWNNENSRKNKNNKKS